jgi:hypothetical protein
MSNSVYVDYGVGDVIYSVDASEAFTQTTSTEVDERGDIVYSYLLNLEAAADKAATDALGFINKLSEFSANVTPVTFDVPDAPNIALNTALSLSELNLSLPTVDATNLGSNFNYVVEDAVEASWAEPEDITFTVPAAPVLSPDSVLPTAPSAYVMPDVPLPTLETATFTPDSLPAPALEDIILPTSSIVTIDDLVIDVETAGLIDAIAAMQAVDFTPPTLPEYTYLIPEIFEVVGSMATGDTIVNYQQILNNRDGLLVGTAPSTYHSFARRGLTPVDSAAVYDTWLRDTLAAKMNDSDMVFEAVAIDECVTNAFKLGTAAHRLLVDIETALYGLDFALAKTVVNANLEKAKGVVAIYRAEVLLMQQQIAQYNAYAAYVSSLAQVFVVNAQQAELVGDINTVTADSFAAEESVKRVAADVYKSLVMGEQAKLAQYKAVVEGYKAAVAQATSAVASYSGAVALHAAEVERISNSYDLYSAAARAKQYENSAKASTLRAEQAELKAYASEADSLATSAAVKAVKLQAEAAKRETEYVENSLKSDEETTRLRLAAAAYDYDMSNYVASIAQRTPALEATSDEAAAISRYVSTASEAVARAAQLSQQGNTQLAKAYADAYEAAGRAGAAVSSGNLTRFRASALMSASDSLDASDSYAVARADSGGTDYSESERYSASL